MKAVSVLMAAYNAMPYLPEAVESVLGQTFRDLEFVIVDDGSTDGSGDYLDSLRDPRVRLIHQKNLGFAGGRNSGLAICEGEFVAIMDADDVSLPDRLERQVAFLQAHPEVGAVGGQVVQIGPAGQRGPSLPLPLQHEDVLHQLLYRGIGLVNPTACIRTRAIRSVGGFHEGPSPDNDLFLRLAGEFRLANLEDVLLLYRLHPRSETAINMRNRQLGSLYNIQCFRHRQAGEREPTYEEFIERVRGWPLWRKAAWEIDQYALVQYRKALLNVMCGHPLAGRLQLAWVALCSPVRTGRRLRREFVRRFGSRVRPSSERPA